MFRTPFSRRAFLARTTGTAAAIGATVFAVPAFQPKLIDATIQPAPPAPQKLPGPKRSHAVHAMYVGSLTPGQVPDGPAFVPTVLENLRLHATRRRLVSCIIAAQEFNRQQLATGIPGRRWAITVVCGKENQQRGTRA